MTRVERSRGLAAISDGEEKSNLLPYDTTIVPTGSAKQWFKNSKRGEGLPTQASRKLGKTLRNKIPQNRIMFGLTPKMAEKADVTAPRDP